MGVEAEVEKKRQRRSSQEITALIEEYRQGGQTGREFCQSHGLALSPVSACGGRGVLKQSATPFGKFRSLGALWKGEAAG